MGYTQRSFWQLYDFADSSPFRETDFEPELLLNFRTDYRLLGLRGRFINVGFNHQSNGRSEPLSRSWNRVVANFGFERDSLVFLLNVWYRIPEDEADDDNPNIEDYLGYGQLNAFYLWHGHRFGLLFRNNLRFDDNRSGLQLSWSFPLLARVSGYVQYFHGYGESLLDYNASANRIGIGFLLKEW
jgi:phospholipase A1